MDGKTFLEKIEIATIIGLITGILYLWGWVYWANFYHSFGLPYSLGSLGIERLLLAGSWYLWFFASRASVGVLVAVMLFVTARYVWRRCIDRFVSGWSARMPERIGNWAARLRTKWILTPMSVLLVCCAYDLSLAYIRADAARDAAARLTTPASKATVRLKGNAAEHSVAYDLLEQIDGAYYLIPLQAQNPPQVLVLRESELESLTVAAIAPQRKEGRTTGIHWGLYNVALDKNSSVEAP